MCLHMKECIYLRENVIYDLWNYGPIFLFEAHYNFSEVHSWQRDGKYQSTHAIPRNPSLSSWKYDREI